MNLERKERLSNLRKKEKPCLKLTAQQTPLKMDGWKLR